MTFISNKEKFIFFQIPVFLFSALPFFLITGPLLSDLAISFISLFFLIYCFKRKDFSYFNNRYFYFFFLFWIYLVINSLINNINFDSLKISFFYFRYGVFIIAVTAMLKTNAKFIEHFFYCILFCFVGLIADGFYQYFFGENILGWEKHKLRISSFFGDELILGSYLSRLWPIFFGLFIIIFNKKDKFFFLLIFIFILTEVLIFLSGERAAFFYINFSAIFLILLSKKLFRIRLITMLASFFLIISISFFIPEAKQRIVDHTINQMNLFNKNKGEKKYIFSKEYSQIYESAYKMYLDNKLLGVGVKNFRNFCNKEKYKVSEISCHSHPHNTYIQILTEIGIIGFLFLLVALFYFCKSIFKHLFLKFRRDNYFSDFEICILSGIAIYLWPLVPTGNVFNNWLNIILILHIPFLIWSKSLPINSK